MNDFWDNVKAGLAVAKKAVVAAYVSTQLDLSSKAFQDHDLQFEEESSIVKLEDEYYRYEELENKGELEGRLLWEYLVDILTGSTFLPYIYWTGNGLEFKIEHPAVVFTELYRIRRGEQPSTMLDPLVRWRGNLLEQSEVDWYVRRMTRRTTRTTRIRKNVGGGRFYYFDNHEEICDRLGWSKRRLLSYTEENAGQN